MRHFILPNFYYFLTYFQIILSQCLGIHQFRNKAEVKINLRVYFRLQGPDIYSDIIF
jgi:hypothetical protein